MNAYVQRMRYPFAVDTGARHLAEEGDTDLYIRQLIRQVLLTAPGERICRPSFGAGIRNMIFSANTPGTAQLAKTTILQALLQFLSTRIKVEDIQVGAKESTLEITITYMVLQTGATHYLNEVVTL